MHSFPRKLHWTSLCYHNTFWTSCHNWWFLYSHWWQPSDKSAERFYGVLELFNLLQHVSRPTHTESQTLDLILTKDVDVSDIVVKDVSLSDHFNVLFDMSVSPATHHTSVALRKKYLNDHTASVLLNHFSSKTLEVMDTIALKEVKCISGKQKAPWRFITSVRNQKRECRKAERKWSLWDLQRGASHL